MRRHPQPVSQRLILHYRPKKAIAMTYNGKSDTYLDSPNTSEGGDLLLDAWRVCLAEVLEKQQREWSRYTELSPAAGN